MSTSSPLKSQDPVEDNQKEGTGTETKVKESTKKNLDVSIPSVPLDGFFTVDNKTRELIHTKLRAYEARRRSAYAAKLESSSLYWRSFRDLLASSVHETGRAERLVLGTARANATYADAMKASYDDTLIDDRGLLVMDLKKRSKLLEVRSEQDYSLAPVPKHGDKKKRSPALMEERRSNMLSRLIDSQKVVAEKFGENSKELESEIANELTQLRVELENKIQAIREIGDAIIAELEATDSEVSKAWDSYYSVAVKTLSGERNSSVKQGQRGSPGEEEHVETTEDCLDVWLVEMHYRVAVAYQSFAWEKGSDELSKLFASMKEAECTRRMHTREYLVAFVQRQERLFMSLPDIHTPVLKDLVGRDMDRSTLEETVQNDIRKRAERLAREEARTKKEEHIPDSLVGVDKEKGQFTLPSPMQSELLNRAKVVERKASGMITTWKLSLAVITVDNFLHLFDIPSGKMSLGSAPEVAFQALIPKIELPSLDDLKGKKGNIPSTNYVKGWCDHLVPSETLALQNCTISQPKIGRDSSTFDIQESVANTGASKMFGKTTIKKVTLRTMNKSEAHNWIEALKSRNIP